MDENGSTLSNSNRLKPIITYRKPAIDQCNYKEDNNGEESFHEFSWPPKSYTCSFCKREFRSAQALGGHMNVHRREKAKLRQMTPQRYLSFLHPQSQFLDQNPNPNPNPNPNIASCFTSNTPSFSSMFPPFRYSCCLPFSDPCGFHLWCRSNGVKSEAFGPRKPDVVVGFSHEKEGVVVKKLDDDLLVEPKFDDLDLELRLGCS